jgi:hypothetical protein
MPETPSSFEPNGRDAHSHHVNAADARALLTELDHLHAPKALLRAWESWALLLSALPGADSLDPALEADVADTLASIAAALVTEPPADCADAWRRFTDRHPGAWSARWNLATGTPSADAREE